MADVLVQLSGIGGLTSTYSGYPTKESSTPNLDISSDELQYADGLVNPFRQPGFLSPACDTVRTITTASAFSGVIQATQVDEVNSRIFLFERSTNPDIYTLDSFTDTEADIIASITAASGAGTDLEIYSVNDVRALFYTYKKTGGGGGDMGMYNYSTFDNTFLSTTTSGGFNLDPDANHKMIIADNGFMYILDGTDIHKFDGTVNGGTNGTATPRVLSFPLPFQCIDGVDGRGYIWIAVVGTTRDIMGTDQQTTTEVPCGVYVWDRQSTRVSMADFISISGIKEIRKIFFYEGAPWVFTTSANRTTEIRKYTGNEFKVMFELHRDAQPRFPDSVQVRGRIVYWIGRNDGILYTMGRVSKDNPISVHKIGNMSDKISGETLSSGGAICIGGARPAVSSGDYLEPETVWINLAGGVTNNAIRQFFPHTKSLTGLTLNSHQGDFRTLVKHLPKLSELNGVSLFYPKLASGSSDALYLQVFINRSSTISQTATITQTHGQRGWFYMPLSEHNVNTVQLGIRYNTAVVVGNQIEPEYAIIHYTRTSKLR